MIRREGGVSSDDRVALDALSLLSKKWHPVVVVVLLRHGPMGFNDLLETIPDLSGKVLSGTLSALSDAGVVQRTVVSDSPLRVEYDLTAAGRDLRPVFAELEAWGGRHLGAASPRVLLADADRRLAEMYGEWLADHYTVVRAHNGDELERSLDDTIDILLVDEGLPGADTQTLLDDRDLACRTIALVSARPDVSLLERDYDDVLRKPVVRETVLERVDDQLRRRGEPADRRERAALVAKLSLLESTHPRERLAPAEAYVDAKARLEGLEQ